MEKTTLYIKLLCSVSIFAGVLTTIIPKGKMKSSFMSLCAVVTISAMIMPLSAVKPENFANFDFDVSKNSNSLLHKTEQAEKLIFESTISDALENKLNEKNITALITVESEINDADVRIKTITVNGDFDIESEKTVKLILLTDFPEAKVIIKEGVDG